MLDENLLIRPASTEEAEDLSDIAWKSKEYWEYPADMMAEFRDFLTIKEEFIEANAVYVMEDEVHGEKIGFYALEEDPNDGKYWMKHIWVVPEYIGTGVGGHLFVHACETADVMGLEEFYALSDPAGAEFFFHMGAELLGEKTFKIGSMERTLPVMKVKL